MNLKGDPRKDDELKYVIPPIYSFKPFLTYNFI